MAALEKKEVPPYMAQLLEQLGWDQGTRIPLADPENQMLETYLLSRHSEIQRLKEAVIHQNQKQQDLDKYRKHVVTEGQENTRLLLAHKNQLEQESKLKQLSLNELESLERDISSKGKQRKEIKDRIEKCQAAVHRLLKKADALKSEVCGERGSLQEWRAALDRSACDIEAIEQFTKQDTSKAKALTVKYRKLKAEHDKAHDKLIELVGNLSSEEKACERISDQVMQSLEERKQVMQMWTSAIENLRQRDTDIRHLKEDYAALEAESKVLSEKIREQQAFVEQQHGNNLEVQRENAASQQQMAQLRITLQRLVASNVDVDNEAKSLERELSVMRTNLEKMHMNNRKIIEDQYKKELAAKELDRKLAELKVKLEESQDKSKSAEKRAKQLEEYLNEEEKYVSQVTSNQQKVLHCSYVESQKLLALKNEEKLLVMTQKSTKTMMGKLDNKIKEAEMNIHELREKLYVICYQLETNGAKVLMLEGAQAEREFSLEMQQREERLREVAARHQARVSLLEHHSNKLADDMRRLTKELEGMVVRHGDVQCRLRSSMLEVEGGEKELKQSRECLRRERVEEALCSLRVAQVGRAVALLGGTKFNLDKQRLQLQAAMNERMIEIEARRDMFNVQKRALMEDCGKLRSEIREREGRIEQLKKRYDIFINSLGKDDSGQQLSVTYFKIKFAAERAELRERGSSLDSEIGRCERDISALEATLRVMQVAHDHFLHNAMPLGEDATEIQQLKELRSRYYELRDTLKPLNQQIQKMEAILAELNAKNDELQDQTKQLSTREVEALEEYDKSQDRISKYQQRLENARDIKLHYRKRAKKLVDDVDEWRTFQLAIWVRDYGESAYDALKQLAETCSASPPAMRRLTMLVSSADIVNCIPKRLFSLKTYIQRLVNDNIADINKEELQECVMSSSAGSTTSSMSFLSGYNKRITGFRQALATKIDEVALAEFAAEERRDSTVSLRVVTLGLQESSPLLNPRTRKSTK